MNSSSTIIQSVDQLNVHYIDDTLEKWWKAGKILSKKNRNECSGENKQLNLVLLFLFNVDSFIVNFLSTFQKCEVLYTWVQ